MRCLLQSKALDLGSTTRLYYSDKTKSGFTKSTIHAKPWKVGELLTDNNHLLAYFEIVVLESPNGTPKLLKKMDR